MFSPYYAWSGWRDPEHHCAINVALYRAGRDRWAMTERGRECVSRSERCIEIGHSSMHWDGDALRLEIDEWTAPLPSRMRGTVTLRPEAINTQPYALDADGRHYWRPIAPRARADVRFDNGTLAWSGDAYFDCNWGPEPLERRFRRWHWSRAHSQRGTLIYYDITPVGGAERVIAVRFDRTGAAVDITPPPPVPLPNTFWRVPRASRSVVDAAPRLVRTLEDTPFYARSQLIGDIDGAAADIMHESLSLDRLRTPIVRAMLPFRMPRIAGRR